MRTTVELPDDLFRQAKAAAALQGKSLKDFFLAAIKRQLEKQPKGQKERVTLPLVKSKTNKKVRLSAERVAEVLMAEDLHGLAGH